MRMLEKMGPDAKEAVPSLITAANHERETVRSGAVWALGGMGDGDGVVAALIQRLKDPSDFIRRDAAYFLGLIGPKARTAAAALAESARDPDPELRLRATFALKRIAGDEGAALAVLADGLKGTDEDVRNVACSTLYRLGPAAKDSLPLLLSMLRAPDTREKAASLLGSVGAGNKEVVGPLCELLKDSDPQVRRSAAFSLTILGATAKDALPFLEAAMRDLDGTVRADARNAYKHVSRSREP